MMGLGKNDSSCNLGYLSHALSGRELSAAANFSGGVKIPQEIDGAIWETPCKIFRVV